jgi:hypothetical protein
LAKRRQELEGCENDMFVDLSKDDESKPWRNDTKDDEKGYEGTGLDGSQTMLLASFVFVF